VARPVDPDLVADDEHGQKPEHTDPLADKTQAPSPVLAHRFARSCGSVKPAR
jgi:hypothetical protein